MKLPEANSQLKIIEGKLGDIHLTQWYYPKADMGTMDFYLTDVNGALNKIKPYMKQYRRVIQAGGAVGIWPLRLAQVFDNVTTFEPEPINRQCLTLNTQGVSNIEIKPFALGDNPELKIEMVLGHNNRGKSMEGHCGAFQVTHGGDIPVMRIDDLGYDDVDLIYLDVEGYEYRAINGARETIARCKPIIGIEDKMFHARYKDKMTPIQLIKQLGYKELGQANKDDVLFIHKDRV